MKSFQYSQKAIGKAVIINTIDKILQNKSANQHRQGRNKNPIWQAALRHTLEIFVFIFAFSLVFGMIVEGVGEDGNGDYLQNINPDSLKIIDGCLLEGGLRDAKPGDTLRTFSQGTVCAISP